MCFFRQEIVFKIVCIEHPFVGRSRPILHRRFTGYQPTVGLIVVEKFMRLEIGVLVPIEKAKNLGDSRARI